jgi:hypothetical protein
MATKEQIEDKETLAAKKQAIDCVIDTWGPLCASIRKTRLDVEKRCEAKGIPFSPEVEDEFWRQTTLATLMSWEIATEKPLPLSKSHSPKKNMKKLS